MNWRHSLLCVQWKMHSLGFSELKFGPLSAFCISSWIATSDVVGALPATSTLALPLSAWINNWASSTFLFVRMHLSANSCWPSWILLHSRIQVVKDSEKGADMLRWMIQFFWLVSVVSHFGEALTCYSCGPHSDQVITFDIFKEWPHFWVRFKG